MKCLIKKMRLLKEKGERENMAEKRDLNGDDYIYLYFLLSNF